jgi:hypothetical protein
MVCCPHPLRDLRVVHERRSSLGRVVTYRCACSHRIVTVEPVSEGFHWSDRRPA